LLLLLLLFVIIIAVVIIIIIVIVIRIPSTTSSSPGVCRHWHCASRHCCCCCCWCCCCWCCCCWWAGRWMMSLKYRPRPRRGQSSIAVLMPHAAVAVADNNNSTNNKNNSNRKIQANLAGGAALAGSSFGLLRLDNWTTGNCTACCSDDIHKYEYNIITWRINYTFFVLYLFLPHFSYFTFCVLPKKWNWLLSLDWLTAKRHEMASVDTH